jgi:class 3 adenylate cyclase/tetratricopeptide (TPR) repeat protein
MTSHLATGVDSLRPYLPRLLIRWLGENPDATHQELEGSLVFVDISGFTKLSERLARRGKVGAEDLTNAIGACFSRLLGIAYGNGGGLIKFGGDALLVFFSGDDHAANACRAAMGMRRVLREIGRIEIPGARATLRMSVGIHTDTFNFFLVGESHRELIVTGPGATKTVAMESTADAGEIVVSPSTASALPQRVLGVQKGSGRLLAREPRGLKVETQDPEPEADRARLLACLPEAIRGQVLGGMPEPEHRQVTVAFVHFDGTDSLIDGSGAETAAEALGELVHDVQHAVDRHGVSFLASDIDRDGGKLILAAGAPLASGNDEERMLLALREVADGGRIVPVRIGVNRGHVFAGDIGPSYRRTYTVMGDAVNLAARLMAAAEPGRILATESVLERSRTGFASEAMEPFHVKGKAKPVQAYSVGSVVGAKQGETRSQVPLIGREREMEVLLGALGSARRKEGRVVEVIGEPGIGKSRLVEELRDRGEGALSISVACELYSASTPYAPFRVLLRALLGVTDPDDEGAGRLRRVIEQTAPHLLPWLPLVAMPLGIDVPPTPETEALEDRFQRARLERAVGELLMLMLPSPTLLSVEDAHWMDEASSDLLRHLVAEVPALPWLICVTRRDVDTGFVAPAASHVTVIRPGPLDPQDAAALVDAATEESPLNPHEITALAERSGGNPLFLRELLAASDQVESVEALPDSVEALITARIDGLPAEDRAILRRASVLGETFTEPLLDAVLPDGAPSDGDPVWNRLDEFLAKDKLGTFRFGHALIRDAAYEALSFRLRRDLHSRVGETIEKTAGAASDEQAELLSLHFFYALRYEEAWRYSLLAGERARALYANVEAAEFFGRALESARRVEDVSPMDQARVQEALGDVRRPIGEFGKADEAYTRARRLLRQSPLWESRLMLKQARIREHIGRSKQAVRWIRRAQQLIEGATGREAMRQRAQLAVSYAGIFRDRGRHADAIAWCERAIDQAKAAGDQDALAHAFYLLDVIYVDLGRHEQATHWEKALEIYEELGDLSSQAIVLNHMGISAYYQGEWSEALDFYERARAAWVKAGDMANAAFGTVNVGEILSDQGRLEEAEGLFREALRVWRAAGDDSGVLYALSNLGRVAGRAGRYKEALALLEEARERSREVGSEAEVVETEARVAECLLLRGEAGSALEIATETLERAQEVEGLAAQVPLIQRVRGLALMVLNRSGEGAEALAESLRLGRARRAEYEVALTLQAMARASSNGTRADLEAEARSIAQRLGIISLPELPVSVLSS